MWNGWKEIGHSSRLIKIMKPKDIRILWLWKIMFQKEKKKQTMKMVVKRKKEIIEKESIKQWFYILKEWWPKEHSHERKKKEKENCENWEKENKMCIIKKQRNTSDSKNERKG